MDQPKPNLNHYFRENVTDEEYEAAVQLLHNFKEANLENIISLSELALAMRSVGDALCKIAYKKGKRNNDNQYEYRPNLGGDEPNWEDIDELPETATGSAISLQAIGGEFAVLTNKSIPYGVPPTEDDYEVLIPVSPINNPSLHISDSMIGAHTFNIETNEWVDFQPRKNESPETIKTYARFAQQGVTDLLDTNLPTSINTPTSN